MATPYQHSLSSGELWNGYIYLDTDERQRFAQATIEQIRADITVSMDDPDNTPEFIKMCFLVLKSGVIL